jgi:dienelactone hydrolase
VVITRPIAYDVDGEQMTGHLARPEGEGPWPVALLGHDGVGLDDYQRGRADDLARHGYLTFAMDYHGGRTFFGQPEAMLDRVLPILADPDRMLAIARAGLDVLLAQPGADPSRIAAVGFGAGASILLELARSGAGFETVAVIHPGLPLAPSTGWADAGAAYLLCTGSEDPICPPSHLLQLGETLQRAGIDWRVNIYGGAQHAFWSGPRDAAAAGDARAERTVPGVGYHATQAARAWQDVIDVVTRT